MTVQQSKYRLIILGNGANYFALIHTSLPSVILRSPHIYLESGDLKLLVEAQREVDPISQQSSTPTLNRVRRMTEITDVENSLQHLKVCASCRVDGSERAEDPRNTEKDQHGTGTTEACPVTPLTGRRLCTQQRHRYVHEL